MRPGLRATSEDKVFSQRFLNWEVSCSTEWGQYRTAVTWQLGANLSLKQETDCSSNLFLAKNANYLANPE